LTVPKDLKAILDQVEKSEKDQGVLISVGAFLQIPSVEEFKKLIAEQGGEVPEIPDIFLKMSLEGLKEIRTVGFGLTSLSDSKASGTLAIGLRNDKIAQQIEKDLNNFLAGFVNGSGLDFVSKNGGQGRGPGMPQPPGGFRGGFPPGAGQQGNQPGFPPNGIQGGSGFPPPNGIQGGGFPPNGIQGGGGFPPNGIQGGFPPNGMRGGFQGGGFPPGGNGGNTQKEGKDGDYLIWSKDTIVALGINVNLKDLHYQMAVKGLEGLMMWLKGMADTCEPRSRIHELAQATQAYLREKGHFPRGALVRAPSADRVIDWRPDQRVSWLYSLLPYLANGEYRNVPLDNEKSWQELPINFQTAMTVIPQFLTPQATDKSYYFIHYPGMKTQVFAPTHFVGIAGIGLDAAEYAADDTATAKLRGVFGYDRETKPGDIKDGPENTIVAIQVPPDHKAPWIAGGGSTVRGVSEDSDCVRPFVCAKHQGKDGTFAIMADGKVRFIPADIKPEIFRALCTIAGGEKIADLDKIAPEVPPPEDAKEPELKTEPGVPPSGKPPVKQDPPAAEKPNSGGLNDRLTVQRRINDFKQIVLAYHSHLDAHKRPPAKAEDLGPFIENDARILGALKSGEYVVIWKSTFQNMPQGTSNTILAYEKQTPEKGGIVGMADGVVKTMTAAEFKKATKAAGK
jgi:hypothetical protein